MTSGMFDANDWMERVAATLGALANAQEPSLHRTGSTTRASR